MKDWGVWFGVILLGAISQVFPSRTRDEDEERRTVLWVVFSAGIFAVSLLYFCKSGHKYHPG